MKKPRLAALAALALLTLSGCSSSGNSTACALYADSYNNLADSVKLKNSGGDISADEVKANMAALPDEFEDAFQKAEGDLAVKIRDSRSAAQAYISDPSSEDAGTAFFLSTSDVEKACGITLHKTK